MKTISNWNILNITNLTDDPIYSINQSIEEAIKYLENDNDMTFTDEQRDNIYYSVDNMIEDFEEAGKVSDALSFVDNMIVNFDFVALAKEMI